MCAHHPTWRDVVKQQYRKRTDRGYFPSEDSQEGSSSGRRQIRQNENSNHSRSAQKGRHLLAVEAVCQINPQHRSGDMENRRPPFSFSSGSLAFVWAALCLLLFASTSVEAQCKCQMPSGNTYDLSKLPNSVVQVVDPISVPTFYYYYKPCGPLPSTNCGGLSSTSAVCQEIR